RRCVSPQQLFVQAARFGARSNVELAAQSRCAVAVLLQGQVALVPAHIEVHEAPMGRLMSRIDREDRARRLDGSNSGLRARLLLQKAQETLENPFTEANALSQKPLLEGLFLDIQAAQQIAAPKLGENRENVRRAVLQNGLNSRHIRFDSVRIESDSIAVRDQNVDICLRQCLAQRSQ